MCLLLQVFVSYNFYVNTFIWIELNTKNFELLNEQCKTFDICLNRNYTRISTKIVVCCFVLFCFVVCVFFFFFERGMLKVKNVILGFLLSSFTYIGFDNLWSPYTDTLHKLSFMSLITSGYPTPIVGFIRSVHPTQTLAFVIFGYLWSPYTYWLRLPLVTLHGKGL